MIFWRCLLATTRTIATGKLGTRSLVLLHLAQHLARVDFGAQPPPAFGETLIQIVSLCHRDDSPRSESLVVCVTRLHHATAWLAPLFEPNIAARQDHASVTLPTTLAVGVPTRDPFSVSVTPRSESLGARALLTVQAKHQQSGNVD
jgi:hypothetical protein